jgi:hypothetical protein
MTSTQCTTATVARLAALAESAGQDSADPVRDSREIIAGIIAALAPRPHTSPVDAMAIQAAAQAGRDACAELFSEQLVVDRLAVLLGEEPGVHQEISAILNRPFPKRTQISVEFLDLLVARIQGLESTVQLLVQLLIELHWPSGRGAPDYVCASSAKSRR